jgi:hypothetical protein
MFCNIQDLRTGNGKSNYGGAKDSHYVAWLPRLVIPTQKMIATDVNVGATFIPRTGYFDILHLRQ